MIKLYLNICKNGLKPYSAFTLAEVLVTLSVVGIVASMTIPTLLHSIEERQMVTGLEKFHSTLQQSVKLWKADIECNSDAYTCLKQQNLSDNAVSNFDQISKFMRVVDRTKSVESKKWLPAYTLNYYGEDDAKFWGNVADNMYGVNYRYLLQDGMTMSLDADISGFGLYVDVNGMKPPNRIGKDTFSFIIGERPGKDIYYFAYHSNQYHNTKGLCIYSNTINCDPNNTNPTVGSGANPTAYVLINKKLPDFKKLSQEVEGFRE